MFKRFAFILALITPLCLTGITYAHASLLRSSPAAGETLEAAPSEMVLEFTEDLDPASTRTQLLDSNNQVINAGPGELDPGSPRIWHLALGELPEGSYIVTWRARSAVDGHVTEGIVPFGIGVPSTVSLIPPANAPNPLTPAPPPPDAASRWLNLLAALLTFGGLFFSVLVWRSHSDALTPAFRKLSLIGGVLFIVTHLFFLLNQAAQAAGVPLQQAIGTPLLIMFSSYTGQVVMARMAFAMIAVGLAWGLSAKRWWLALLPAGASILAFSLAAHGASEPQGAVVAVAADFLHVAATVVWLGGLLPLLIAINTSRTSPGIALPLAVLIPRFSVVALVSVGLLSLTGLYSYFIHINQLDLIAATTYGRTLAIKTALFVGLIVLGAINLFIFSPRLRTQGSDMAKAFGRTVRTELIIGTVVLLAVGAMTSVAPSLTAVQAQQLAMKDIAQESVLVNGVRIKLYVAPAKVGSNEFVVDVTETRPGAEVVPAEVLMRLSQVGHEDSELQVVLESADGLRYAKRGSYITAAGDWNVEIIVRRSGFNDSRVKFELTFDG